MSEKRKTVLRTIVGLGLALGTVTVGLVSACGQISGPGFDAPPPPAPPSVPGVPAPPPNPPVGVVNDAEGFYVRYMLNSKYVYVDHKGSTTMTTACTAEVGELADCYVEGMELDLAAQGIGLQYNVPSTMCTYFRMIPYYYFSRPANPYAPPYDSNDTTTHWAPALVHLDVDSSGLVCWDTDSDGSCQDNPGAVATETCRVDYTQSKGPNCCEGPYTRVTRSWDPNAGGMGVGGYGSISVSQATWGGAAGNCLDGPALDVFGKDTTTGLPIIPWYYVEGTGINSVLTMKSIFDFAPNKPFVWVANYFETADYPVDPLYPTYNTDQYPNALVPFSGYAPSPYYDFLCYDAAQEVIAEIRVSVRGWTTKSAFEDLVANPANFEITGNEPAPWVAHPLKDRPNWKSMSLYPAPTAPLSLFTFPTKGYPGF